MMIISLIIISFMAATLNFDIISKTNKAELLSPETLISLSPVSNSTTPVLVISAIVIIALIFSLLYYFHTLFILYISIYNEKGKLSFKQAFDDSLDYFWKLVGLMIIFGLIVLTIEIILTLFVVLSFIALNKILAIFLAVILVIAAIIFVI